MIFRGASSPACKARDAKLRIVFTIFALLVFASGAQSQSADWKVVQDLKPGTRISVKAQKKYMCWVESVTPDVLTCSALGPFRRHRVNILRTDVREVRLERDEKKYTAVGIAIGGGVGAAVGARGGPASLTSERVIGTLVGGFAGGCVGGAVGKGIAIFHRGKVIYKR